MCCGIQCLQPSCHRVQSRPDLFDFRYQEYSYAFGDWLPQSDEGLHWVPTDCICKSFECVKCGICFASFNFADVFEGELRKLGELSLR